MYWITHNEMPTKEVDFFMLEWSQFFISDAMTSLYLTLVKFDALTSLYVTLVRYNAMTSFYLTSVKFDAMTLLVLDLCEF